jgi:hypothetical protein
MYDDDNYYRRIVDRIRLEAALEETMDEASAAMVLEEMFNNTKVKGEKYERGYYDGWWESMRFYNELNIKRWETVRKKYVQLSRLWRTSQIK